LVQLERLYFFLTSYILGLYEYTKLSEEKQWEILWDKGEFLTNLKLIDKSFSLYAIDKFFVEVVWKSKQMR